MAISSSTRKAGPFLGNDVTTVFPFAFKVFAAADLRVVNTSALGIESDLVIDVDYTVALNSNQDNDPGGSVTRLAALPTGERLTITSDVEALQPLVLTNNGGFYPRVINDAFDKITIIAQQLIEQVGRSLKLPISSSASATLPDPIPNGILAWNSAANGFVNVDPTDLATVAGYADARVETFNGDGTETEFEIDFNPGVLANLDISISGVTQVAGVDFTWIGTTITFTTAPPAATVIQVRYARPLSPPPALDAAVAAAAASAAAALVSENAAVPAAATAVGAAATSTADAASALASKNAAQAAQTASEAAAASITSPPLLMAGVLSALGNSPYWIRVRESDAVLFVLLTNDFSLQSYSLADPANPVLLDTVAVGTSGASPAYLALDGAGNVYVTDQVTLTLRVVAASDPSNMSVIATLVYDASGAGGGGRCDVSPNGDYLCIGGPETGANANRAYVVDISTPASPVVVGSTAAIGSTHRGTAWVSNTVFAVASRDDKTLMLVNAATPSAPVLVGSYVTPSGLGSVTTPVTWDAGSATLFVGNFLGGTLLALDVSTPATPTLKDSLAISDNAEQIAVTDTGRVLVACRNNNTLVLVNCANPADLSLVATYVLPGTTTPGVGYYDGFTYVTCAGDTTNGKVFVLAVEPTLEEAIEALQAATTSVSASSATKAGNTFSGTQTITPVAALALTSNTASISFGTTSPDTLSRTGTAAFSWPGTSLALGNVITYSSGAMLRAKASPATSFWAVEFDAFGDLRLGAGTTATDVRVGRRAANVWGGISTHISCSTAGFGFRVAEGSNAKQGTATLVAGVVTVANTSVTANSRIFLQRQTDGGTVGASYSITRTAGTSFTITAKDGAGANQAADTSTLAYEIFEPA